MRNRFAKHAGVSLIEVLTAVLVLALGAIGAAGMHVKALRATHESGLQSTALRIAAEMAERMRLHHAYLMRSGGGENPFIGLDQGQGIGQAAAQRCHAAACDAAQLAQSDIHELEQQLQAGLPGGRMVVCRDAQPWDAAQGAFKWGCDGNDNASVVIKVGWREREPLDDAGAADAVAPPAVVLVAHP